VACHNPWRPVDASPRAVPHRSRGSVRRVASMPSYPGSPSGTHAAHGPITGNGAGAAVTGAAGRLDPEVVGDLAGKEGGAIRRPKSGRLRLGRRHCAGRLCPACRGVIRASV
jgi:hypothetical protein